MNAGARSSTWLLLFAILAGCSRTEPADGDAGRSDGSPFEVTDFDVEVVAFDGSSVEPMDEFAAPDAPDASGPDGPPATDAPDASGPDGPPATDAPDASGPDGPPATDAPDASGPDGPPATDAPDASGPDGPPATDAPDATECRLPRRMCGASCVDLASDGAHCGACGNACSAGRVCRAGRCECVCPPGQSACGTDCRCVNFQTDPAHCGRCGNDCNALPGVRPGAARCVMGQCDVSAACVPGRGACGTAATGCTTDLSMPNNCGACGRSCPASTPLCAMMADGSYACTSGCPPSAPTRCGMACVNLQSDVNHCGRCNNLCYSTSNGMGACVMGTCTVVCAPGYHRCETSCPSNLSIFSCGPTSCSPCPAPPPNAVATCDGVSCGFACNAGYHRCGNACVPNNAVTSCGTSCTPCPVPANGTATCNGVSCGIACNAGFHLCSGACVSNTSVASCGTSCTPCPVPANGTATCNGVSCDFVCNPGFSRVGSTCVAMGSVAPPRPVWPPSTATVTTRRPSFQWVLAAGSDGARVQVCRDRGCASVVTTFDVAGSMGAPSADLPAGVLFWRLLGRSGASIGSTPSVAWEITLPARGAPIGTAWGSVLDVNADGVGDILAGAPGVGGGTGRAYIHAGMAGVGITVPHLTRLTGLAGSNAYYGHAVASAGDVNGDGYADVLIGSYLVGASNGRIDLYFGAPGGPALVPSNTVLSPDTGAYFGYSVAAAGDVNRDGYGDIVVGGYLAGGSGRVYVFYGNAGGISARPDVTLNSPVAGNASFGYAVAGAGDVNADGYADVVVGANGVGSGSGAAYLYLGGPAGLATTPAVSLTSAGGAFGTSVGCAGDVNGDGYADVAVGAERFASNNGRAYVFLGRAGGPAAAPSLTLASPSPGGFFGTPVTSAGDVNGDGFSDLLVGAQNANGTVGQAHVFHGSTAGLSLVPNGTLNGPDGVGGAFGYGAAGAGDVNADGFGDLVVGAFTAASRAGRVHVYLGSAAGIRSTPQVSITAPDGAGALYGTSCD